MKRMLARTGRAVAAIVAGAILTGCHFAVVPPKSHAASASPTASTSPAMRDPYGARVADAPALLTQCAVDQAGLRPGTGLDWFSNGKVSINTTNASNFTTWWGSHSKPGPYPQTFLIAGHQTHYLEFGAAWVKKNGQWEPTYTGNTDRKALQYSLAAWANWTAVNGKLPPLVCGTSLTAHQLQAQIYGSSTPNPW
ncbi:MAG TPA: hypothetical protein VMV92_38290 [Streptosporangiaceae bacterium]|nr:hypothetical protein [Streptosporangiaceae bacterium]